MGLRIEHKDKVKSITILDDSIMIHMDNDVKSTFVFDRNTDRNTGDEIDRAWVDNIIACAESLIRKSRDEKVRSRKYMSKLYANEKHHDWVGDLYNDHEDFIDEVERHNNKSSDGGDYGDVGDEYDH